MSYYNFNNTLDKLNKIIEEEVGKSIEFNLHFIHYLHFKTGMIYIEQKEFSSAIEHLRISVKSPIFTIHISALTQLAIVYESLNDHQAFLQCYINIHQDISRYIVTNRKLDVSEKNDLYKIKTKTLLKLASIYLKSKDIERTLQYLSNILDYDPTNTDALQLYENISLSQTTNSLDSLFK